MIEEEKKERSEGKRRIMSWRDFSRNKKNIVLDQNSKITVS